MSQHSRVALALLEKEEIIGEKPSKIVKIVGIDQYTFKKIRKWLLEDEGENGNGENISHPISLEVFIEDGDKRFYADIDFNQIVTVADIIPGYPLQLSA
mgnify:CR=1 FL=1